MTRRNAREVKDFGVPFTPPYFRIRLKQNAMFVQHSKLIELELLVGNKGGVCYAAPEFACLSAFNDAYVKAEVHLKSALFSPCDISCLPSRKEHTLAYKASCATAYLCSEPRELKCMHFSDLIEQSRRRDYNIPLVESVPHILEGVFSVLPAEFRNSAGAIREKLANQLGYEVGTQSDDYLALVDLLLVRELSRVGLGCELLILQPRK